MPKKKVSDKSKASVPPELTETEADLLWQMQHGYQLETSSLTSGPILRRKKDDEVVRPVSANLNTVKALEEGGLIEQVKGNDPLTTVWRVKKRAPKPRDARRSRRG